MKLHIGVDADSGLVHSMRATAANVADVTEAHRLLHGEEREACYQGVEKRPEQARAEVAWRVAMRPGLRRLLSRGARRRGRSGRGVAAGAGGAPLPRGEAALRLRQGALPRSGQEPGAAGAAAGLDEPAQSRAPTRLTRGAVRPPRPSKRDGRANEAPALPRPPPLRSSLSNTTCCGSKSPPAAYLLRGFLAGVLTMHDLGHEGLTAHPEISRRDQKHWPFRFRGWRKISPKRPQRTFSAPC